MVDKFTRTHLEMPITRENAEQYFKQGMFLNHMVTRL